MKTASLIFLTEYLDFFIEYLKILPEFLEEYIESTTLNNDLLYLFNSKVAIFQCNTELIELTKIVLGNIRN